MSAANPTVSPNTVTTYIKLVDKYIQPLIWLSIILLFVEIAMRSENTIESRMFVFLLVERITGFIFMMEYFARWYEDHVNPDGHLDIGYSYYPLSIMGIIDLVAWLPFFVGFFVPTPWLRWVRAMRILRAFKLFRYNRHLQLWALSLYEGWWMIKAAGIVALIFGLLASAFLYEAERYAQPELFGNILNLFWYTIVSDSTIGYGDMYPQTAVGKVLAIFLLILPGITIFSTIIGIVTSSWTKVMEWERDPNFDPIAAFATEYARRQGTVYESSTLQKVEV